MFVFLGPSRCIYMFGSNSLYIYVSVTLHPAVGGAMRPHSRRLVPLRGIGFVIILRRLVAKSIVL